MNQVILIGNLTRDPELSYTPNTQTAVCHFDLAVNRPPRNGENQGVDFFHITSFGALAQNCDRFLSKGRQAAVSGRIELGSYKNRDGMTVPTVDIIASNVEFLRGGQSGDQQQGNRQTARREQTSQNFTERQDDYREKQVSFGGFDDLPDTFQEEDDDIPF